MNRFAALGLLAEALDGKQIAVVVREQKDVPAVLDDVVRAAEVFVGGEDLNLRVIRTNGCEAIRTPEGGGLSFTASDARSARLGRVHLAAVYLERYAHVDPDILAALMARGTEVVNA